MKKVLSILLSLLMVVTTLSAMPFAAHALDGEGTAKKPYKIGTAAELKEFRDLVNDGQRDICAVLTADIDLNNEEWTPIGDGTYYKRFNGTFDGQSYTVSGLNVNITSDNDVFAGLFGGIGSNGTVQNLTVRGTISGAITDGITGFRNAYAGGIAARNDGAVINCCCNVAVTAQGGYFACAGGLVGANYAFVTNCRHSESVTAGSSGTSTYCGGIVGIDSGTNNVIENCYNTGNIKGVNNGDGVSDVGGIDGYSIGKKNQYKKVATVKGNVTKYDIAKLGGKALNPKKNVKAYVVAYKKKGKKYVKKGKTAKIKATVTLENKNKKPIDHVAALRYYSTNKKVATVDKNGKITAKKKGKATIYIYANNGVSKKVVVTVK